MGLDFEGQVSVDFTAVFLSEESAARSCSGYASVCQSMDTTSWTTIEDSQCCFLRESDSSNSLNVCSGNILHFPKSGLDFTIPHCGTELDLPAFLLCDSDTKLLGCSDRWKMKTIIRRLPGESSTKRLKTPLPLSSSTDACESNSWLSMTQDIGKVILCKCKSILVDPVTLPCGHTFCKPCINDRMLCAICGLSSPSVRKVNIFLAELLLKICPDQYNSAKCRSAAKNWLACAQYDKALDTVNKALALNSDDVSCYVLRSEIYEKLGRCADALEDATLACERDPESGPAFYRLGAACACRGDIAPAIDAYQRCLELNSDDLTMSNAVIASLDKLIMQPKEAVIQTEEKSDPVVPMTQDLFNGGENEDEDALAALNRELLELESEMHNPQENLSYTPLFLSNGMADDSGSGLARKESYTLKGISSFARGEFLGTSEHHSPGLTLSRLNATPLLASLTEALVNSANSDYVESGPSSTMTSSLVDASKSNYCTEVKCAHSMSRSEHVQLHSNDDRAGMILYDKPIADFAIKHGNQKTSRKCVQVKRKWQDSIGQDDFECKLCFELLFRPVTTPCGHVFCKDCLMRTIDYSAVCPICRQSLLPCLDCVQQNVTVVVEQLGLLLCCEQYTARKNAHEQKMERLLRVGVDEDVEVPIFVCMIAFPTLHYPLHVFEPRYKHMIRQCMDSGSRRFGMCDEDSSSAGFADMGTILEIEKVETMPDGRFIVHTTAWRRFLVRERFLRDGCHTARVSFFSDEPERLRGNAFVQRDLQYRQTYDHLASYMLSLGVAERDCVVKGLGQLPAYESNHERFEHGVAWIWYGLAALPLNRTAKLVVLRSKCLSERLVSLERFLRFMAKFGVTPLPS